MGVTEPSTGTDTTKIKTSAVKKGDRYVVNGQKVWISRIQHSELMILLARTTPLADVQKKSEGLSIFIVDLREAIGHGLTVRPIANMVNHETNELFFENLEIPDQNLIGQEGKGFRYILDGLNAERTLIAAECIGDGYWFIDRVSAYVKERQVFGRPIGQNQGVQFPIAESHIEVEAANLMRWRACELFDAHQACGAEANMAKYLAAKASWEAANACLQFHGGFGFACEYDVERKFRETRLYQVAPISTNMVLSYVAEHVLGLPRSLLSCRRCTQPQARSSRSPPTRRAHLSRRSAGRPPHRPAGPFVDGLRCRVQPRAGRARLGRPDLAAAVRRRWQGRLPPLRAGRGTAGARCAGVGALDCRPAERPADPEVRHRRAARLLPAEDLCGSAFFCIGMSEPQSGSDLAGLRTRATRRPTAGCSRARSCGPPTHTARST